MKKSREPIIMTKACEVEIANTVGHFPVERGILFLARDGIIQAAIYDKEGEVTDLSYSPGALYLTKQTQDMTEIDFDVAGIGHSHKNEPKPSWADNLYYHRLCKANGLNRIFVPIIFSQANGRYDIFPFIYDYESREVQEVELIIISEGLIDQYSQKPPSGPKRELEKKSADFLPKQPVGFSSFVRLSRQLTEVILYLSAVFLTGWSLGFLIQLTPGLISKLSYLLTV